MRKGKRIRLGKEYVGYTLARNVYKDRNMLLISEGHELTESLIEKMMQNGVNHVYIHPQKGGT